MRIQEERHENEFWLLWKLGNLTAIDSERINSKGIAWLFKENGKWVFKPREVGNQSLFYNAIFFIRFCWPLGLFLSLRWSPSETAKALFQTGLGWKLNGRFAILFRIQSDETSAAGVTGPNTGQARGFEFGTH